MSDWKTDVRSRLSAAGIKDPDAEAARIVQSIVGMAGLLHC